MADLPPYPDTGGDTGDNTGVGPERSSTYSTPRWVKVFGIIFITLIVVFIVLHFLGLGFGGHHGPMPSGGMGNTWFADLANDTLTIEHVVQQL